MASTSDGSAVAALPIRALRWAGAAALVGSALWVWGVWQTAPELALAASIAAGAAVFAPRARWAAPVIAAGTFAAGAVFEAMSWPAVLGAGAAAGALVAALLPERTDGFDLLHGALGSLIASTAGLLAPDLLPFPVLAATLGAIGLLPVAWRYDYLPPVPTRRGIERALPGAYRPPALDALDVYERSQAPSDPPARRGLAEVTRWVLRLQTDLHVLDRELAGIAPERVADRIAEAEAPTGDDFTRERRLATVAHLRRLLEHREALATERGRTEAMSGYALAFLEEARAGLALSRALPGEGVPDRLPEVLARLRSQATAGEVRRRTARELSALV